ncbi:hypothetical protein [Bacillus pretiosus]|uniref:hypothetical protein n=1 Tax=Bacillus TaxID=1386 RepID=UPI003D65C07A
MKHKKIYISVLLIITFTICFIRYNSVNAAYKNYKIDSIPVVLNKEFDTKDFKITYANTKKNNININGNEYIQYLIGMKMRNKTSKNIEYPSSKFFILAPNFNYNQSLYLYNEEKKPINFNLKPDEEIEGYLIFKMPYHWGINNHTSFKIIYSESDVSENKTNQYKLNI